MLSTTIETDSVADKIHPEMHQPRNLVRREGVAETSMEMGAVAVCEEITVSGTAARGGLV